MRQEPVQAAADGYINSEFHGDEPQAMWTMWTNGDLTSHSLNVTVLSKSPP